MPQLFVEVFDTPITRAYGLMNRDRVPAGTGALFLFPDSDILSFWGKNTLLDLDIIFVSPDWTVESVKTIQANDLTSVQSDSLCIAAIETNHEWCRQIGVNIGMKVNWDREHEVDFE